MLISLSKDQLMPRIRLVPKILVLLNQDQGGGISSFSHRVERVITGK